MSKKGVIFLKILISEFFGLFWNSFRFFLVFFLIIIPLKMAKSVELSRGTCGADVARPREAMWTLVWHLSGARWSSGW